MTNRITIDFTMAEGAVIRMLGLIERRGFEVRGLDMAQPQASGLASMTVELSARDAGRRLDVLDLQLRRLNGIHNVSNIPSSMGFAS